MSYTPILTDPTEEHENGKKCSNWYCNKILDCNDYDDICNVCHNEPEQERCQRCDNDILTPEEVEEKMCFECIEELEIIDENTNFKNL